MRTAADSLAGSTLVIAETLETILLPLAALNAGRRKAVEYFNTKFATRLDEVTSDIPAENLQEPPAYIAGPLMNGLADASDEPELEDLFMRLLGAAMDQRAAEQIHPSFVQIIRELSPAEIGALLEVLNFNGAVAIVQLRSASPDSQGSSLLLSMITEFNPDPPSHTVVEVKKVASWHQNWQRLGLIEYNFENYLTDEARYKWAENHYVVRNFRKAVETRGKKLETKRGILVVTDFGRFFAASVSAKEALEKYQNQASN